MQSVVELSALRRLTANITTSATPIGDGEGALSVVASRIDELPPLAPTYGYGIIPCADVTRGPKEVEMFVLGSGRFGRNAARMLGIPARGTQGQRDEQERRRAGHGSPPQA